MLIEREHYLELLHKTEFFEKENELLARENHILALELEKQRGLNLELMERMEHIESHAQTLNKQLTTQNEAIHNDLKGYMTQLDQKQRDYLGQQF
jgi:hypothetical protein